MDHAEINEAICHGLARYWSPEQIAGRLQLDDPDGRQPVSARTIYNWIAGDEHREHWRSFLRRRGRWPIRRKKPGRIGAPLAQRPEVIEGRPRLGDFESDTVLGPPSTGGLATLVDRKSRLTIVVKIRSKQADHVYQKIKQRLKQLDQERCHSVTFDHGTEFASCYRLEKHLSIELYHAEGIILTVRCFATGQGPICSEATSSGNRTSRSCAARPSADPIPRSSAYPRDVAAADWGQSKDRQRALWPRFGADRARPLQPRSTSHAKRGGPKIWMKTVEIGCARRIS